MYPADIVFPHLGIEIQTLDRVAFSIFGFSVYWYGVLITTGMMIAILVTTWNVKRTGGNPDLFLDFIFIAIPISILGARLYYVVFQWDTYKDNLIKIFAIREGGLAIYGAVLFAFATVYFFTKKHKLNFWEFADTGIVGLVLGQAIGRIGNFFNREVFGGYTDTLFAMRYPLKDVDASNVTKDIFDHLVTQNGMEYIQVHPTFLYESVWNFALFAFLMIFTKHKKFHGQIFAFYLFFYGLGRFIIEGIRTDQLKLFQTNIPVSQMLSFVLMVFGFAFLIIKGKQTKT